jgi:hypothetical protein
MKGSKGKSTSEFKVSSNSQSPLHYLQAIVYDDVDLQLQIF